MPVLEGAHSLWVAQKHIDVSARRLSLTCIRPLRDGIAAWAGCREMSGNDEVSCDVIDQ